jgi:hypothetical protein
MYKTATLLGIVLALASIATLGQDSNSQAAKDISLVLRNYYALPYEVQQSVILEAALAGETNEPR